MYTYTHMYVHIFIFTTYACRYTVYVYTYLLVCLYVHIYRDGKWAGWAGPPPAWPAHLLGRVGQGYMGARHGPWPIIYGPNRVGPWALGGLGRAMGWSKWADSWANPRFKIIIFFKMRKKKHMTCF